MPNSRAKTSLHIVNSEQIEKRSDRHAAIIRSHLLGLENHVRDSKDATTENTIRDKIAVHNSRFLKLCLMSYCMCYSKSLQLGDELHEAKYFLITDNHIFSV